MTRHDTVSRPPVREQSADMLDMTTLHTTPYHMSIEKVDPCHQQVQSRARVADHHTSSCVSGRWVHRFSVPDLNTLWSWSEDDLLVWSVANHSTSDVFGRDWIVFLCVTFRGSPFFRSSLVVTKDTDPPDSTRPIVHLNVEYHVQQHFSVYLMTSKKS